MRGLFEILIFVNLLGSNPDADIAAWVSYDGGYNPCDDLSSFTSAVSPPCPDGNYLANNLMQRFLYFVRRLSTDTFVFMTCLYDAVFELGLCDAKLTINTTTVIP